MASPSERVVTTAELSEGERDGIRALLARAFAPEGGFRDDDWLNSLGGTHVLIEHGDAVVSHASVVTRTLEIDGRPVRTGYVEAVATEPGLQGHGLGSRVMAAVATHIRTGFELGALSTGRSRFYERLGWLRWQGPTFVRTDHGTRRTPDDDEGIFVLLTPSSPAIDPASAISCEWRPGDVW